MKYIGNYFHWIDPNWEKDLLLIEGDVIPHPNGADKDDTFDNTKPPWKGTDPRHGLETWEYMPRCVTYRKHNFANGPTELPFDIDCDGWTWFFVKIYPGHAQPIHQDYFDNPPLPTGAKSVEINRFWIPLQNYKRGHILLYEDTLIANYKAGDVFQYQDPTHWHAGANMGHTTRLTCNLDTWKYIYQ